MTKKKRTGFRRLLGTAVAVLWLMAMPALAHDERGGTSDGTADWNAGLSAWQGHRLDKAHFHFERLAQNPRASKEMASAGAYWAARVHLKTRHPKMVAVWLNQAARRPDTFYGLLAHRALGFEIALNDAPPASAEIGLPSRAHTETNSANGEKERAGRKSGTCPFAAARYLVPAWRPDDGWRVDRAFILAVARQESKLNPKARGPSGALGLMQLLPSTASFISRTLGQTPAHSAHKASLYRPEINLMLGQLYVEHILEDPNINNNLLYLLAAYNWGPHKLIQWVRQNPQREDPLLFLALLPREGTRLFVEQVMTHSWMYRIRLEQPVPALDALASGLWPVYIQLDPYNRVVAENVSY